MKYCLQALCVGIVICIMACSKKCPCHSGEINLGYIGFSNAETETIILRRFIKGTNYSTLKDTGIISASNSSYYQKSDTLQISLYVESLLIGNSYDYELFLPKLNKLSRINDVIEEKREDNCIQRNLHGCKNRITAFRLNGQIQIPNSEYPRANIHK